jgi:truncated hemoglobin YjbI
MKKKKKISTGREEIRSLIEGIGGPEALFGLLLGFYELMSRDVMIGFFFDGKDLRAISRRQGEFILMASGLSPGYHGKGPSTAHAGLPPILAGHFDRRLLLLRQFLGEKGLSTDQIRVWSDFEESFREIVVRRTHPS